MGTEHVHTAENIRNGVEHSLRTLQTDHLDLVQFHRSLSRDEFDAEGALAEALTLRDEGKVRFVGVSAVLPTLDEQIDMGVFDAFQIPYSALQREHEDVIARASEAGMGIIIRGGVARGAPDDWQGRRYYMVSNETMRDYWERAKLDELLDGMSRTAVHAALHAVAPCARHDDRRHQQHRPSARQPGRAVRGPLPDDVLTEAKNRLTAAGSTPSPTHDAPPLISCRSRVPLRTTHPN